MSAHNQAAEPILGTRLDRAATATASSPARRSPPRPTGLPSPPTMFPHVKTLSTGESEDGVVIGVTDESGRRQWLSMSSRLLSGASQTDSPMVVCSFTDVTDRRAAEAQLHWLAYHDSLTGLGNRSFFNDELERELLISMQSDTNLAVLFIDLDRFKLVNDSFGHSSGDELLLELARRFKTAARKGDVVSRFSGDEFVVLCPNVRDREPRRRAGRRSTRRSSTPPSSSRPVGRSSSPAASGWPSWTQGGQTAQDILQQADTAMFKAKNKGRSRIEVFDESLRVNSVARLEIYDDLRHSIEHDELVVHYQPIASVANGKIVALEALVRWNHPTRGLLGPMEFIPFAEETDLIFSLGRWVLREACHTMARWRRELPGAEDAYITVNLSVHQLSDATLLDSIAEALADSGLPPEALVLEVTESLLMSETAETVDALERHPRHGRRTGHRRLRHRRVVAGPPQAVPGEGAEDRQVLRRRPRDPRDRRGHRGRHRPALQGAGPRGPGRGGRDPRPARAGGRARVRPLPGLPDVAADQRRPRRLLQDGRRRPRRQTSPRSGVLRHPLCGAGPDAAAGACASGIAGSGVSPGAR